MLTSTVTTRFLSLAFLVLFLQACGEDQTSTPDNVAPAETGHSQAAEAGTEPAKAQSAAAPLSVVSIAERGHDGGSSIAVRLSLPLDPLHDHQPYLGIHQGKESVDGAWVLDDSKRVLRFLNIQPETEYSVTVRAGLTAANGKTLGQAQEATLTTRPMPPAATFAADGMLLPADVKRGLPVTAVNVAAVDIEFLRVVPEQLQKFLAMTNGSGGRISVWQIEQWKSLTETAWSGRFDIDIPDNKRQTINIPVHELEALQAPGLYVAILRQPGQYSYEYSSNWFYVSDIGLQVRHYEQQTLIAAASLATGAGQAGAQILVWEKDSVVDEAVTDKNGITLLNKAVAPNQLITAHHNGHVTVLRGNSGHLDLSDFEVHGQDWQAVDIFIYGPRDLYRPGETATFAALLRDGDGKAVADQPLAVELVQPDGRVAAAFQWQPRFTGYYEHQQVLADDAMTGDWRWRVSTDPAAKRHRWQTWDFKVEEFLPERMKLALENPTENLSPDENWKVDLQGDYLYGAPAAGNEVLARLTASPSPHPVASLADFFFGDANNKFYHYRALEKFTLDDDGKGQLEVPAEPWAEIDAPITLKLSVDLMESGGRPVTRSISNQVWPAESLIGIRPLFDGNRSDSNSNVSFEIVRSNAEGEKLAANNLHIQLIRESRDYYWEFDDHGNWQLRWTEEHYPVDQQSLSIPAGQVGSLRSSVEWGTYRLEVEDPANGLISSYRFQAGWSDQDNQRGGRPDQVKLSFDKPSYQAGETAKVRIEPPHEGTAWLYLESDELLWQQQMAVTTDGLTVELPIDGSWNRHDIYLSAVVMRPSSDQGELTPQRAVGVAHVKLDRSNRQLAVSLTAPASVEPKQTVPVAVSVPDAKAGQARVTLAAVDVGVLSITRFATPNPLEYFFGRHGYGVTPRDIYDQIIEQVDAKTATVRWGGDAAFDDSEALRAQAKPQVVSIWSGAVALDADGKASIDLPLPDFNGQLKLVALAFDDERFGTAAQKVTVAAPLVTQLAMPRFLGAGDRSTVALDITNLSPADESATVSLTATGPVQVSNSQQKINLPKGKRQTLLFELEAGFAFASSKIKLSLQAGQHRIDREWTLMVRPAWPSETRKHHAALVPGEVVKLPADFAAGLRQEGAKSGLIVSDRPPLDLQDAIDGLISYPYGCVEQTTSRAWPLLYLDRDSASKLGAGTNLPELSEDDRLQRIADGISRLVGMQKSNGGFGMWDANSYESVWLSVYATDFLLTARDLGHQVPSETIDKAIKRISGLLLNTDQRLRDDWSNAPEHFGFGARAYAAYVLAQRNRAPLGSLRNLHDNQRKEALSPLPLVWLGLALELQGDKRRAEEAYSSATQQQRVSSRYLGDYGSDIRDTALSAALLLKHDQADPANKLIWQLRDALAEDHWLSTQDRFALFMAARQFALTGGDGWAVSVNGRSVSGTGSQRIALPWAALQAGTEYSVSSAETLFSMALVSAFPATPPAPTTEPISIQRRWYDLQGNPLASLNLASGDLVLTELQIKSTISLRDAIVEELLPAGLELENQNLEDSNKLGEIVIDGKPLSEWQSRARLDHEEYRDDRYVAAIRLYENNRVRLFYLARAVTPGEYRLPPTLVSDMYRPEIRGVGSAVGAVTVKR